MRNWFDIIPPHEDIRKGHFDEAVFAADLGDVAAGVAAPDYRDPYLFFKKTYLTRGLRNLLERVQQKLASGSGPGVVEIQTPFGGGKTHALVAIYHTLKHGDRVQELLPPGLQIFEKTAVSVIAGNHWDPVEGRTTEGITRHTFWGEIAYKLAGARGYAEFRSNDEARISPGKERLRAFLESQQPFVLLFDEILEYVNRALDRRDELGGSLGTQTFSFFQELTEAVSTLPRGMLVVTLPSSYLEDFGERQEESLARLNKIFGRVESIETPVQGEEVYAVIRRRLFDVEHLKVAEMRQVVYQYAQAYQENHGDLPPKARDANFREKMELAYPFHPDVIDILYEKWSTFSSFQRTRGVLRLLANVVEDLYQRETNIDLILPGDLNLDRPAVRQEFLRHVGTEYEGIIGSDIAGHEAKAQALDAANKAWKHLAQRIATAVFFHSFSADASAQGINLPYIKLAVLRSETIPALVTEILQRLANTLWYLNARQDAYFFSRIPNLNRMILDKKELFNASYRPRMKQIIERELGKDFVPYLWPEESGGHSLSELIPDNRSLKLVLLEPEDSGAEIPQWIERKGAAFREYQNTLFFALADTAAFAGFREDVKTILALEEIATEVKAGSSRLPAEKLEEVRQRLRDIERDLSFKVRRMYHTLRAGRQEIELGQPVTGNETLSHWYWRELTSGERGRIVTQLHYRILVNKFLATVPQVASGAVLDQFYKNLELPVPSETGVVARAIQLGVQEGAVGLADVRDGQVVRESLRYKTAIMLADVTFAPEEVLVARAQCEALLAQWAAEDAARQPTLVITPPDELGEDEVTVVPPVKPPTPVPGAEKAFHRVHLVIADIPASKIADVNRGVFMPLSNLADGGLTFTLELDVTSTEGIPQATLEHKVKETLRQIGARVVKEERDE
ncbi:MAG: ATP-binding protein [Anaerolineae bacterium]|nr:ATP-binding protein [Anaerolineae bacterium]